MTDRPDTDLDRQLRRLGERATSSYEQLVDTEAELVELHGAPRAGATDRSGPDSRRMLAAAAAVGAIVAGLIAVSAVRGNSDSTEQAQPRASTPSGQVTSMIVTSTTSTRDAWIVESVTTSVPHVTSSANVDGTHSQVALHVPDIDGVTTSVASSTAPSSTVASPSYSSPPQPEAPEPSPTAPTPVYPAPTVAPTVVPTTTIASPVESTAPPAMSVPPTTMPIPCMSPPPAGGDLEDPSPASPIGQLRRDLIGRWQGEAEVPSGWNTIGEVAIEFRVDGTYEAVRADGRIDNAVSPALYYGRFCYCPRNKYAVVTINDDGSAEADIDISWQDCSYSTRGLLHRLEIVGDTLTFEFFPVWLGMIGPIRYELHRVG